MNTPALVDAITHTVTSTSASPSLFDRGNSSSSDPMLSLLAEIAKNVRQPNIAILSADHDYVTQHNKVFDKYNGLQDRVNSRAQ